jgi:hypothetical protein
MATMIAVMVISFLMLFCKICLLIAIEKEIGAPLQCAFLLYLPQQNVISLLLI